jgi:hypothetical protein
VCSATPGKVEGSILYFLDLPLELIVDDSLDVLVLLVGSVTSVSLGDRNKGCGVESAYQLMMTNRKVIEPGVVTNGLHRNVCMIKVVFPRSAEYLSEAFFEWLLTPRDLCPNKGNLSARFDQLCYAVNRHRWLDPVPSVERCDQINRASWWIVLEPAHEDLGTTAQLRLHDASHLGGRFDRSHNKTTIDQWLRGDACSSTYLNRLSPRGEVCVFHDVVKDALGVSGSKTVVIQSLWRESL